MTHIVSLRATVRKAAAVTVACTCLLLVAQPTWAALDYSSSLAADFVLTFPGGDPSMGPPTANPFGASTEWELHGPGGTAAELAAHGGLPASGQNGWCQGDATGCNGDPQYSYFAAPWQPGVTVVPGIAGHGVHDVLWTAPGNVDEGGVSISGSIEQMFESARVLRLQIFKNGSGTASYFVDSMPPTVDGVVLNRVDFGPVEIPVSAGDTLEFLVDGSGEGGNGVPTFVAWNVDLTEAQVIVPEPTSLALMVLVMGAAIGTARRRRQV